MTDTRFALSVVMVTFFANVSSSGQGVEKRQDTTIPVPAGAKIAIELDRKEFFLGEDILLHFVAENVGKEPFSISMGGDRRGATRALRYQVTARDGADVEVPDPDPDQINWGGLGHDPVLKPGERYTETLQLYRYCRIEKPGTYTVRVFHDLGWKEAKDRRIPTAEMTIKVRMPTAEQARMIVEEMYRLPDPESIVWGERQAFQDFAVFRDAVYLPIFVPRAQDGCKNALTALGNIPDAGATKALINLLKHKNSDFARAAMVTLKERLPDPELDRFKSYEHRRWLVRTSWRKEFAEPLRQFSRELLKEKDVQGLQDAAFILTCVGEMEDLPQILRALDRLIADSARTSLTDTGAYELWHAGLALCERGAELPLPPRTAGERLLFARAIYSRKDYRPVGLLRIYADLLQDKLPAIRLTAVKCLPDFPRNSLGLLVPKLLVDADEDVQAAACWAARKLKTPEMHEPLLQILATTKDVHLFHVATGAGMEVLPRLRLLNALVQRLDDDRLTLSCLRFLSGLIKENSNINLLDDLEPAEVRACKRAWQEFLKDRAGDLERGQTFHFDDPDVPVSDLFPKVTFWRGKSPN